MNNLKALRNNFVVLNCPLFACLSIYLITIYQWTCDVWSDIFERHLSCGSGSTWHL